MLTMGRNNTRSGINKTKKERVRTIVKEDRWERKKTPERRGAQVKTRLLEKRSRIYFSAFLLLSFFFCRSFLLFCSFVLMHLCLLLLFRCSLSRFCDILMELAHLPGASSELFISEVLRCQVNQPKKVSKCQHLWIHEQDQRMPLDDEDLPSSSSCSSWLMFISSIQSWATRLYRILLQSDGERKALWRQADKYQKVLRTANVQTTAKWHSGVLQALVLSAGRRQPSRSPDLTWTPPCP